MRITLFALSCSLALGPTAYGEVHVVLADGSGDYPTIQAAVDATVSGDVIELGTGRFRGAGNRDVDLGGRQITIRSVSGNPYACVISPEGSESQPHRGFVLQSGEGREVVLEGFTVSGGLSTNGGAIYCSGSSPTIRNCVFLDNEATGPWSLEGGGGISCEEGASPEIEDCIFRENESRWGGGLHSFASAPILKDCRFERNSAYMGGGAWFDGSSTATVVDCEFLENEASSLSAAVMCVNSTTASFSGTSFIDNVCGGRGGALTFYAANSPIEIVSCTFLGNSANKGGALVCQASGAVRVESCTLVGNSAETSGGVISCRMETPVEFIGCTFYGNSAAEGAVAAVESGATVTFERSILSFSPVGGSVHCDGGGITLTCSDVYGNAGGDWIGCVEDQLGVEGNIWADPAFCDPLAGDLSLDADSPCADGQTLEGCGQMGALGVGCGLMGVPDEPGWNQAGLCRAFPNPTSQGVWVSYLSGDESHHPSLRVVDASGRIVKVLDAACRERGRIQTYWDGRSTDGRPVPGGVYYLEYASGGDSARQRVVFVR